MPTRVATGLSTWNPVGGTIRGQEFSTWFEFDPAVAPLGDEGHFRIMEVPGP